MFNWFGRRPFRNTVFILFVLSATWTVANWVLGRKQATLYDVAMLAAAIWMVLFARHLRKQYDARIKPPHD